MTEKQKVYIRNMIKELASDQIAHDPKYAEDLAAKRYGTIGMRLFWEETGTTPGCHSDNAIENWLYDVGSLSPLSSDGRYLIGILGEWRYEHWSDSVVTEKACAMVRRVLIWMWCEEGKGGIKNA